MKKIGKDEMHRLESAASTLQELKDKIDTIVADCNSALSEVAAEMEDARQDAFGVLDDLVNEAQSYYDEKSEKWQEGEAGSQYQDWITQLENARDSLDYEITLEVGAPDTDTIDTMVSVIEDDVRQTPDE